VSVVIETKGLTKIYESSFRGQDVHALKELDLSVRAGEIFAYLGPNGSGKTTTIASAKVRRNIGYLPEGAYYPDFLRGEEILRYYGQLYGLRGAELTRRIGEVLEEVGMTHAQKRLLRGYSKGMRQRIGLAQALISDPQILILDEPTTGLDPIARKEMRDILARLRDRGKTLMISSHELLEVELISDRAGILYQGELQKLGTIDELLTDRDVTLMVEGASEDVLGKLAAKGITAEDKVAGKLVLRVPNEMSVYDALALCKEHSLNLLSVAPRRETLEELFVRTVGEAQNRSKA
jgi:ABC-2 type transport system ATP-binding protein